MEYGAGEVIKRGVGRASAGTYVFHSSADPAPEGRPVAVFLHAWGAVNPVNYGGWIEHLARRGYLVLFPAFQTVGRTRPADAATIAAGRIKEALAALADDAAAKPNLARVAYIGHSAGAGVAAALAALAEETGLPAPRLVFMLMPGGIASDPKSRGVQLGDLSKIGPRTALLTMVGDRDAAASDRAARRILREATAVPVGQKLFMRSGSDDHGFPTLSATLSAPGSPREGYDMAAIRLPPDPPVNPRERQPAQPRFSPDMVLSGEQIILLGQINRSQTDTLDFLAFGRPTTWRLRRRLERPSWRHCAPTRPFSTWAAGATAGPFAAWPPKLRAPMWRRLPSPQSRPWSL
jgi:dienelactone hydrolase